MLRICSCAYGHLCVFFREWSIQIFSVLKKPFLLFCESFVCILVNVPSRTRSALICLPLCT